MKIYTENDADPQVLESARIAVLGYSMGGHVALRFAAEVTDPRVTAVAAACAPLHLTPVSGEFDRRSRWLYRYWVLRHLRRSFADIGRAVGLVQRIAHFHRGDWPAALDGLGDYEDDFELAALACAARYHLGELGAAREACTVGLALDDVTPSEEMAGAAGVTGVSQP